MTQIVGVDIGAALTKVIQIYSKGKIFQIATFKYFPTPYQNEETLDEESFFEQLFAIIPQAKLKAGQLAVGIPASCTNFSFFELPTMAKSDLQRAVISEAQRTIRPTPADDDILRFIIFRPSKLKETRQLNVLAGAGVHAELRSYFSLFEKQGITPNFIGSASSSLMVYGLGYLPTISENWCFIDIGYTNTTIVVFSQHMPTLVRTIMFATRDFIQAIANENKIDEARAKEIFLKQELSGSLASNWEYLISEIRRSFAYYKEISDGKIIECIYFCGGALTLNTYFNLLKKNIGGNINLFELNKLNNISFLGSASADLVGTNSLFANALGLALSVEQKRQVLNFLPTNALKEQQARRFKVFLQRISLGVAVGLIVIFLVLLTRLQALQANFAKELSQFSEQEYQGAVKAEAEILAIEREVKAQADFVAEKKTFSQSRRKFFSVIAKYIPTNASIQTTELGKGSAGTASRSSAQRRSRRGAAQKSQEDPLKVLKCEGTIVASFEDAIDQLRAFLRKLRKTGLFSEVNISYTTLKDEPFLAFSEDFTAKRKRKFKLEVVLK